VTNTVLDSTNRNCIWESALRKAQREEELSLQEVTALLESNEEQTWELFATADEIRRRYVGDEIHLRGIIEFSNYCQRNCLYCGLRRGNKSLQRYRMPLEEIVECARMASGIGFKTVVLQSGEDPWYTIERIEQMVRAVKSVADVAITLSIGERPHDEYRRMRMAGADRYLLKHETADEGLYRALHPDCTYSERLRCLRRLKEVGFQVGAGSMVGLPGQTTQMMAKDILLLRDLDVDMAGIGPFIPNPDTPLGEAPGGTVEMTLKMIALARIVTKDAHIPATTALSTIDALGREKAWRAGANVVMPNLTPIRYREHYRIYPNKACLFDETRHCWTCLHRRIASVGRRVSTDYGHSQRSSGMKPASSSGEQESSTLGYQRSNPIGGSLATQYGGPEQHG